jgi:hypothetical protein
MLEKFKKYRLVNGSLAAAFLLVLAGFLWTMISFMMTGGPFILHFDDLQGITMISGRGFVVFMGIFGMAMVFINGNIALELESRESFWGKLIAALTVTLAVLLFIAFAAILSVN